MMGPGINEMSGANKSSQDDILLVPSKIGESQSEPNKESCFAKWDPLHNVILYVFWHGMPEHDVE